MRLSLPMMGAWTLRARSSPGCSERRCQSSSFAARFNRGKGNAVRRGAASTGDFVPSTDADLSTPIEELKRLHDRVRRGADIAIGSRGLQSSQLLVRQPLFQELLGRVFNFLGQWTILSGIWATQCGFKLFRAVVARKLFALATIDGFAFDVEVLGLAARASYRD